MADNMKGSEKMAFKNDSSSLDTVIKVIGVGNGGCNAVNRMIEEGLKDVEFIAMNTDAQALSRSNAPTRIVLGDRVTQGLGAGTDPDKGAEAAREDIANIEEVVSGANLVFIASSFGGGTGTGASPVVAEAAKKAGALTIGVVTKPFEYEGKLKMSRAESGIDKMLSVVDSLIIIPNENLYDMVDMDDYSYEEALSVVDDILRQGVQGISDIITQTGFINVDFADVKTMISLSNGRAHLGIGVGKGDDRLQKAITNAFENPLLDVSSIKNARGILANIVCPKDFAMKEYREASKIINNYANDNANIKIGVCPKEDIKDEIIVTIVATGFDANSKNDSENKDVDSHANDIINKSVTSNKKDEVINNNTNTSNDTVTNKTAEPVVESKSDNKVDDKKVNDKEEVNNKPEINKVEVNKVEINEKIIAESKTASKNIAENIVEIDNINTIVKEPEEEKEVELETAQTKTEIEAVNNINVINNKSADKIVVEEEKQEIKEQVLVSNNNDIQETKEYKFENNIRNLKKPLITKTNRFNNINENTFIEEENKSSISNEENYNKNDDIIETFNRTIVNNNSEYAHRYETKERISEEMRFEDEEKHNNPHSDYHKKPFDIVSDDYMEKHNKMGSKMSIFGETYTVDNDLEKPAFLRRQIQARNTMR
ncbi:Cell division protein FtsZ [Brachyspira intermedia PWS/A]|uniref:Cell division protein FtsZ n=1 Tax=Brachyspira intermedia (strain ATCC 51140 / PWS/A) TaxID=1045858 RepID=G0EKM5_BRAIP|nr:Cell division protein FtsZ [Brachyspira intermedia PWS/A]